MKTKVIEWVLRVAVAGEFIGHGAFALQGKKEWVGWFATFGISDPVLAAKILFLVGLLDVALGILVLVRPIPAALLFMTFWGFWTALSRRAVLGLCGTMGELGRPACPAFDARPAKNPKRMV